jgi:hypothetical protein
MANKTPAEFLARPGDSDETSNEIAELLSRGFRVGRPNQYQLKIARFNYYPNTGRITIDPCHRHSKRGFDALIELLDAAVCLMIWRTRHVRLSTVSLARR